MLVEGSLRKTSRFHIPPTSTQYEKCGHLNKSIVEQKHRISLCSLAAGVYITIDHMSCLLNLVT